VSLGEQLSIALTLGHFNDLLGELSGRIYNVCDILSATSTN